MIEHFNDEDNDDKEKLASFENSICENQNNFLPKATQDKNHFYLSAFLSKRTSFEKLQIYHDKYALLHFRKLFLWFKW